MRSICTDSQPDLWLQHFASSGLAQRCSFVPGYSCVLALCTRYASLTQDLSENIRKLEGSKANLPHPRWKPRFPRRSNWPFLMCSLRRMEGLEFPHPYLQNDCAPEEYTQELPWSNIQKKYGEKWTRYTSTLAKVMSDNKLQEQQHC